MTQELKLRALQRVNFDWTSHLKSVWRNSEYDVDSLHYAERQKVFAEIDRLCNTTETNSPLGMVFVGNAGSGKTHLLSAIRHYSLSHGAGFILADLTNVDDFWMTILQGYVNSLQQAEEGETPQFQKLAQHLIAITDSPVSLEELAQATAPKLAKEIKAILAALVPIDRSSTTRFQDVIRALLALNSDDLDMQAAGYNWLSGLRIDQSQRENLGFSRDSMESEKIVEGLSWMMSLQGPTVLALDQLDGVVAQYRLIRDAEADGELPTEQRVAIKTAKLIVEKVANGLSALRDRTTLTLSIVSCIETTWTALTSLSLASVRDRFHSHDILGGVTDDHIAQKIVELRLKPAYQEIGFVPDYPAYPFSTDFFRSAVRKSPREILKRCNEHREHCLRKKEVVELRLFDQLDISSVIQSQTRVEPLRQNLEPLDQSFETLQNQIDLAVVMNKENEDLILGLWLQSACHCLLQENQTIKTIDPVLESEFQGDRKFQPLHARISLIFDNNQEKHLCFRALQQSDARAFINRLEAAMNAAGIRKALDFRRLMIVRTQEALPKGPKTQELTKQFREAGGLFGYLTDDELKTLGALHELKEQDDPNFHTWLRDRRPVSQMLSLKDLVEWFFKDAIQQETKGLNPVQESILPKRPNAEQAASSSTQFPIGSRLIGQQAKDTIALRLNDLTKHTVVLAGSGSGKTVLIRRIVEEATLLGIPAIVIDSQNDLARLGDRWEISPDGWQEGDAQKADRYHQKAEVVIWTPGRESANPLNLNPLPDFEAVKGDPDELSQAIDMAHSSLCTIVADGKSKSAKLKQGVLREALQYFASESNGSLQEFATFLSDLPPEAGGNISDPQKKAVEMADLLHAAISTNPLLRQSGTALDPALLFGLNANSDKTRISVISFVGLPGLEQQQQFLNQLAMTLFTWIKKNPAPVDQPIRSLLVIDEAKNFVPSVGSTPCKASLDRLSKQARKYGLGLIFATQTPKSIDHNIIANCSTQFYGRAQSPSAIDVIREQLRQRGNEGQDIAKLGKGQFYVTSESLTAPTKIIAPFCLSYHPPTPLDEAQVLQRAIASRQFVQINN